MKSHGRLNGGDVQESLSVRRAWIEIAHSFHGAFTRLVALREESVD